MKDQRTAGLVIIQDGKIRLEKYGLGFSGNGRWTSFSVAKSVTSTLVGAAIKDGYIKSIDDKVSDYIPDLKGSVYDDVTIKQLLTMTSGAKCLRAQNGFTRPARPIWLGCWSVRRPKRT
jgi:CubicO group peptidase (beta-lactamase class C family)